LLTCYLLDYILPRYDAVNLLRADAAGRPGRSEGRDEQFLRGAQLERDCVSHDLLRLGTLRLRTRGRLSAGFTPGGAPVQKKMWGPLIYEYPVPPPDCVHPTLSGPTRTVVIIDILLTTRAAMHTTIAAAADWQLEASLSEANCKRVSEHWSNTYMLNGQKAMKWGPPVCGGPCSAEHAELA